MMGVCRHMVWSLNQNLSTSARGTKTEADWLEIRDVLPRSWRRRNGAELLICPLKIVTHLKMLRATCVYIKASYIMNQT